VLKNFLVKVVCWRVAPVAPTATRLVARTFFLVNNATNLSEP
jgi:hypothetical protein